jgi:hypothetical protein
MKCKIAKTFKISKIPGNTFGWNSAEVNDVIEVSLSLWYRVD